MKAKISYRKMLNEWSCRFTIGVQTFTLYPAYKATKHDAMWQGKMLRIALGNLKGKERSKG